MWDNMRVLTCTLEIDPMVMFKSGRMKVKSEEKMNHFSSNTMIALALILKNYDFAKSTIYKVETLPLLLNKMPNIYYNIY
jgi:hypothetical protein